ncbi:hypothetical protein [Prevotella brunnea]|nr:hypothetical protein [Prevotella brunnea]
MRSSFYTDLLEFMLTLTKFQLMRYMTAWQSDEVKGNGKGIGRNKG